MEDLGREKWALQYSKWDRARIKYPELTEFIEKLYTTI
jgi:hypothetical protein